MYEFEGLVGELLQTHPELDREEVMRRIGKKKETVGAGYLTDQGALFLVAGELGVSLRKPESASDTPIKDLYIGSNDVNVAARVLAAYPLAAYKKKEGGTGNYRRFVLFDGQHSVRLTAWDQAAEGTVTAGITMDTPIRVTSGYVKQGLDGKPNLNLGRKGRVEVLSDEKVVAKLPTVSSVAEKLAPVSEERQLMALQCSVSSEPRYNEFVRADGSEGSLYQFTVVREGGKAESRVVIWSPSARPELRKGQRVLITNLRTKRSSGGDFEFHGDAGSAVAFVPSGPAVELRVAASGESSSGTLLMAVDSKGRVWAVEKEREGREPASGEVIRVVPDSESGDRLYCKSKGALSVSEASPLPDLEALATKLRDAKDEGRMVMVEVIALSPGVAEDVGLKDGTTVRKGELTVGDDTWEMKLVGWRDLSSKVEDIQPGQRLRVVGVTPKTNKMGTCVLQMSNLTVVEKLRERS